VQNRDLLGINRDEGFLITVKIMCNFCRAPNTLILVVLVSCTLYANGVVASTLEAGSSAVNVASAADSWGQVLTDEQRVYAFYYVW
jgi:hypothetical protein